jgi:hypothetical protein
MGKASAADGGETGGVGVCTVGTSAISMSTYT